MLDRNQADPVGKWASLTEQICAMFDDSEEQVSMYLCLHTAKCWLTDLAYKSAQLCELCPSVCGTEVA